MSTIVPENLFYDEARLLSISARFGLAMCFLNEFCHRFEVSGETLNEYREHVWACPIYQSNGQDFNRWYSDQPTIVADGLSRTQSSDLKGILPLGETDFGRLVQIFDLTYEVLQINFYGAGENEGTYELLLRISKLARPSVLPATTPFKFSGVQQRDGWGSELIASDVRFWRVYSENWFRLEKVGS